jgi:membrane protein DedA with SNARE-associated domain
MSFLNLGFIGQWLAGNGYAVFFVLTLVEGPIVTAAAAFAAALGYFNIYLVFLVSLLGNFIPDAIYYAIGYWGREQFVDQYGHYLGLTKTKVEKIEKMIEEHAGKSLIAIKLIPFLATPGLIITGMTKMDLRKYALWNVIITVPSSLLYLLIGYYFGAAYTRIIHNLTIGIVVIALVIVGIFFLQKKLNERFAGLIEKD